jgi:PTS system nitrogen regulatory IIA component
MPFSDLLPPGGALGRVRVPSKRALFQLLAERGAALTGQRADAIGEAMNERERLGVTGFGGGIAIPHGRLPGLPRPVGLLAILDPAVDYDALDGAPVDLAFLLLTAEDDGAGHLKTLARVSRALRDRALVAKLRGAASADALWAVAATGPLPAAA